MQKVIWLPLVLMVAMTRPTWSDPDCDRDDAADRDPRQRTIRWPSPEGRDLQATLDAAPSGSRIELAAGDFAILQPLVVAGKRLTIIGAGSDRRRGPVTRLIGPAPQDVVDDRGDIILPTTRVRGLWSLVGADVRLAHVAMSGFDAAIVTTADAAGLSGSTTVRDVDITNTGRGILALAGDLTVKRSTISNTRWNGISIAPQSGPPPHALVEHTTVLRASGAAIYISGPITATVSNVIADQALLGGIVTLECDCDIGSSIISNNTKFGIQVAAKTATIHDNKIFNTHAEANGKYGDGVSASDWNSLRITAVLDNNEISGSDRAGVSVFGAEVTLADDSILCAAFDIDIEEQDQILPTIHDAGMNTCGCGSSFQLCKSHSSMLMPPPMVAGLE